MSDNQNVDSGPRSGIAVAFASGVCVFAPACRGLWVSVTGDVKVDFVGGGTSLIYPNVPVGYLAGHFTKLYQTGTTATVALAVWND